MAANSSPAFHRLNSVDRHGRHIDPAVLAVAEDIFPRALDCGLAVLGDSALVANVLEEAAAKVSRLLKSKDPPGEPAPIQDLAAYIFRAFLRDVNRLRRKQLVLVSAPDEDLESLSRTDPSRQILAKILADEFLARCEPMTQDMFGLRMQGFSWGEIGRILGISAHSAEKRFSQALRRALVRLKMVKSSK